VVLSDGLVWWSDVVVGCGSWCVSLVYYSTSLDQCDDLVLWTSLVVWCDSLLLWSGVSCARVRFGDVVLVIGRIILSISVPTTWKVLLYLTASNEFSV
jgi:hypothetical protein